MAEQRFYATGKKKTSIARVWMKPGAGNIVINQRTMDDASYTQESRLHHSRQPYQGT
jgi:small subunit ribosomal protein S9